MKKRIGMFLAAAMVAMCAQAYTWKDPDTGYTWTYSINGETAEIYKSSSSAAISPKPTGSLTIPASLGGKTVTRIGYYAFYNCSGLTSVTIPDSVTSIGWNAFDGCSGLTSVTIGNGVTSIGEAAFSGCSGLEAVYITDLAKWCGISFDNDNYVVSANPLCYAHKLYLNGSLITDLTIPDGVASIGEYAFKGFSGLTSVTIPDSVTTIGGYAFKGCTNLTSVTIGNGVTSIGYYAFSGCRGLTSVTIGNGVKSIGDGAFYDCTNLTSVTIPGSVTSIGREAFEYCSGLTSVTIGNGVTSIGYMAFRGCSGLTSVTIPDSVTSIGYYAFSGCRGLTSVTIPGSVTSIGREAFEYCSGLTSVTIGNGVTSIGYMAFRGCSGLTSVTIPDSVTSIGWGAFEDCSGLTSVTIPDSVTSIGGDAFYGCSDSLFDTETIPGVKLVDGWAVDCTEGLSGDLNLTGVRGIGSGAFEDSSGLTSVTIPDSVTSIGDWAFSGCSGLTSVTIGNGVTSIGYEAFSGCSGLTSVTIPSSVTSIGAYAFSGCSGLTSVTIPDSVTSIGDYAFSGCSGLTSVTIGNGVTSIGYEAFSGCSRLTSVTIPDSVTSIGGYAFDGCSDSLFDTETIPGVKLVDGWAVDCTEGLSGNLDLTGVRGIGDRAFSGCDGLASVTIPDSVTSIGDYAFSGCSRLKSVTIPDSVTSIGNYAFHDCRDLTSVAIPDPVTSIGDFAFRWCIGLASVTIGNGVTSIGNSAFDYCSGLKAVHITDLAKWCEISFSGSYANPLCNAHKLYLNGSLITDMTIPDGVTSIGEYAFYGCGALTSVTIPDSVTSIGREAFYYCSGLTSVTFMGNAPAIGEEALDGVAYGCVVSVPRGSTGWGVSIPGTWNGLRIEYLEGEEPPAPATYTVTYKPGANGGGSQQAATKTYGVALTLKGAIFTRRGYTQTGWSTSDGGAKAYDLGASYTANAAIILYPFWMKDSSTDTHAMVQLWEGGPYWATTNIGAENPEDYGYYFWWGDTVGYTRSGGTWTDGYYYSGVTWVSSAGEQMSSSPFSSSSCPTYNKSNSALQSAGWIDSTGNLVPEHDAAHVHWGGGWRMPTKQELSDLNSKCDWAWTTQNGVQGYLVKGKGTYASASIFLPCAGGGYGTSLFDAGSYGGYWSSVPDSGSYYAWGLGFDSGYRSTSDGGDRDYGRSVRPVQDAGEPTDTYTVMYKPGASGSGSQQTATKTHGVAMVLKGAIFTRMGYVQTGWATSDGGAKAYDLGASYTANAAIILYPFWMKDSSTDTHAMVQLWEGGPYWADANIGAENPEDYGYYFWWGDTVGYKREGNAWVATDGSSSNFSFSYGNAPTYNKAIATLISEGWITADGVLAPEHDAAHVHWGGDWRMPTHRELYDLTSKCDWAWTTQNGVQGYLVKGKGTYASASIFLPCAGVGYETSLNDAGSLGGADANGGYWSSEPASDDYYTYDDDNYLYYHAWGLDLDLGHYTYYLMRRNGRSVRPVRDAGGPTDTYTVMYKPGVSGSGSQQTATKTHGVAMVLKGAIFTRKGYTQTGWAMSDGGTKAYDLGASYTANAAITLYPFWTENGGGSGGGAWAPTETVDGIEWSYRVENGKAEIYAEDDDEPCSAIQTSTTGAIAIPSMLGGYPVTIIGECAFYGCSGLTSVTIPDSVTIIGGCAFEDCSGLTSVTIPNSMTNIERSAFYNCSRLLSIVVGSGNANYSSANGLLLSKDGKALIHGVNGEVMIPDGVTSIGSSAFYGCSGLTSVTMPDSVECIGDRAFSGCRSLASVTIGDGVTSIGDNAFSGCSGLTSVTIPDSVTSIGEYAFFVCSGLTSVTIPNSVTSIGEGAFENCRSLTNVTVPGSVESIGDVAFFGCSGLASVTIGDGVTSIGEEAFYGCSGLTSVTIPGSVTSIGRFAFEDCSGLANMTFMGNAPAIGEEAFDGVAYGCVVRVLRGSTGWGVSIPGTWNGLRIEYIEGEEPANNYKLTLKANNSKYGTVSGGGMYAYGTTATLKAAAKTGNAFAGWFTDKACTKPLNPAGYDNRSPTVKIAMPENDTTIYAKFVSKGDDKAALKFTSATKKLATTPAKATAGAKFSLKIGASSLSLPTFSATGLPKGLSINKATGEISGVGTVPGAYTAKVTITSAAGNKITQNVKITVNAPSWAKGTFYGTAKPGKKGDPMAYLQFTVGTTGKVSGKVTYKGKAYSFTSTLSSCTASKATFTPKVKIGKATFKPGAVTIRETENAGGRLVEAANTKGTFAAQKKANLVKKGKALAELVGKSFTFTKKTKNSGLTKSGDKLKVKLADGDKVTASGTVNGKKLAALSAPLIVSKVSALDGMTTYTLYADILDAKTKYYKTVVFTVKVPVVLKPVPKVSAAFAK